MPSAATSIVIGRPIGDVFAVLSDVTKTSIWHPAAVEERWTSDGPPGVGSTRRAVATSMGRTTENEAVVTVFDPPHALGLQSIESPIPFTIHIALSAVTGGTEVVWTVGMEGRGWRRGLAAMGLRPFMRQLDDGLVELRALMESGRL